MQAVTINCEFSLPRLTWLLTHVIPIYYIQLRNLVQWAFLWFSILALVYVHNPYLLHDSFRTHGCTLPMWVRLMMQQSNYLHAAILIVFCILNHIVKLELCRAYTPRARCICIHIYQIFTYVLWEVVCKSKKYMVGRIDRRGQCICDVRGPCQWFEA